MPKEPLFLTGLGQDSHRLSEAREGEVLTLAGLPFACGLAYQGVNSDGDVILHALYNAVSTAVGGGSLGPVGDKFVRQGVKDSREYIKQILQVVGERGYRVANVSVSIEGSRPKMEKYLPMMAKSVANLLEIERARVGLSVTSGEGLTAFGRGEGLMASVSVLLEHQ